MSLEGIRRLINKVATFGDVPPKTVVDTKTPQEVSKAAQTPEVYAQKLNDNVYNIATQLGVSDPNVIETVMKAISKKFPHASFYHMHAIPRPVLWAAVTEEVDKLVPKVKPKPAEDDD